MTLPRAEGDLPIFRPEPEVGRPICGFSRRGQLTFGEQFDKMAVLIGGR
jgi:hypothetical protein